MRRLWAAGAAIPISLALLLGTVPATAQSPPLLLATPTLVRYEDPVGDQRDGIGPDIVAVTVSQPDPTSVTIALEFAVAPPLGYDMVERYTDMLVVLFATDPEGLVRVEDDGEWCDFVTAFHGYDLPETVAHGAQVWGCQEESPGPGGAVAVAVEDATLSLTLTRESLGDPDRILFLASVGREGETESSGGDYCPDNPEEGPITLVAWTFPTK
jgi:hypothetical protein